MVARETVRSETRLLSRYALVSEFCTLYIIFSQVSLLHQSRGSRNEVLTTFYGRIESFWVCHLPQTTWTANNEVHVLALFSPCARTEGRNANTEIVEYQSLLTSKIIAANTIESLVGRVKIKKDRSGWVIVDRSGAFASTVLLDSDDPVVGDD